MRRLTVRGIIVKDGKILGMRLTPYRQQNRDFWCVPGGGVDDDEPILDALRREMVEETGVEPVIGELLYVQQYIEDDNNEQLEFFFHIQNADDYQNIDLSATTHGLQEVEVVDFIDPTKEHVLPLFLQAEPIQQHIDTKAPAKFYSYLS